MKGKVIWVVSRRKINTVKRKLILESLWWKERAIRRWLVEKSSSSTSDHDLVDTIMIKWDCISMLISTETTVVKKESISVVGRKTTLVKKETITLAISKKKSSKWKGNAFLWWLVQKSPWWKKKDHISVVICRKITMVAREHIFFVSCKKKITVVE